MSDAHGDEEYVLQCGTDKVEGLGQAADVRYSRRVSRIVESSVLSSVEVVVCTVEAMKVRPPTLRRCGGAAAAVAAARLLGGSCRGHCVQLQDPNDRQTQIICFIQLHHMSDNLTSDFHILPISLHMTC